MYKELNEVIKNISVVSDDTEETKLTLPKGMDEEGYISHIKTLLDFAELNFLTIDTARKLFQDAIDMLKYHLCIFGDAENLPSPKANGQNDGLLKYGMYEEHCITSGEFINKYKLYYAPHNLPQEVYFEMLMQLDDFIKEKGLTIKQAQNLLSDCIKMLLQSR